MPKPRNEKIRRASITRGSISRVIKGLFARYQRLVEIGAATTKSVDTAKAQIASYATTVTADAVAVQNDKLQFGFTTLYAPFDGRVGMREADIGAIVHPSDTIGIVTVTQMEPDHGRLFRAAGRADGHQRGGRPVAEELAESADLRESESCRFHHSLAHLVILDTYATR